MYHCIQGPGRPLPFAESNLWPSIPVVKSLYQLRYPGPLWTPKTLFQKFKMQRTGSKITVTFPRITIPNFVEICWHFSAIQKFNGRRKWRRHVCATKLHALGEKPKHTRQKAGLHCYLTPLVVAHKLQSSYTPCGKFSHSMTLSLIYLLLLKETGKVIPNSPCIHHTHVYIQEYYLQIAMFQRGRSKL